MRLPVPEAALVDKREIRLWHCYCITAYQTQQGGYHIMNTTHHPFNHPVERIAMRIHFPMSACRQECLSEYVPGGEMHNCFYSRLPDTHMSGTNADEVGPDRDTGLANH